MHNDYSDKIINKKIIHQLISFTIKLKKVMQNYLDETGVFHSQHRLLMFISHNPDVSQNAIARSMDVSPATVAVSLKKLEKGGYIKREMNEEDNRLNKIIITRKGNEVAKQSREILESADQKVFEGFTEDEKATLSVLLQKLNDNLARMEEEIKLKKRKDLTR